MQFSHVKRSLAIVTLLVATSSAQAAFIPADIGIEANVGFFESTPTDGSFEAIGNATQVGMFGLTVGGVRQASTVDNVTVTGSTPLTGSLQETGDGIELSANISGDIDSYVDGFFFDFDFDLFNLSSTTIYTLIFQIDYSNSVFADANGSQDPDDFADSEMFLVRDDTNEELFFSDLLSDDRFGNEFNGVETGAFGGTVSDANTINIPIVLPANGTINLFGQFDLVGGAFDGRFSGDASLQISLLSITSNQAPPSNVSAPQTLFLFMSAFFVFIAVRKRQLR